MIDVERLKRHAALFDRMAGTLGLDLEARMRAPRGLAIDDLGEAVLRCAGCTEAAACEGWMAAQETAAPRAPGYCRNADLFARLAAG